MAYQYTQKERLYTGFDTMYHPATDRARKIET